MASVRMGRLLLAQDCAPLLHLLMVDAVVPLIALDGVEDMHAQIFKSLQLQDVQRSAMATFWRQWVARRHALDCSSVTRVPRINPHTRKSTVARVRWFAL